MSFFSTFNSTNIFCKFQFTSIFSKYVVFSSSTFPGKILFGFVWNCGRPGSWKPVLASLIDALPRSPGVSKTPLFLWITSIIGFDTAFLQCRSGVYCKHISIKRPDLEFVKKFTGPNFRVKEFYTLKTRKLRLFSPALNSENASLSVIWPSFG